VVAKVRILVVDDEQQIAQLLTGALRSEGYEAEYVTSGGAALERMRGNRFDVLVTDLRMPEMDGMQLIEAARAVDPELDALIMTAYASQQTAVGALRRGVADYLPKPFGLDDMRQAIDRCVRARDARRAKEIKVEELSEVVASTRLDLEQRVADLSFLHDLTRLVADRARPLTDAMAAIAAHFHAERVLLVREDELCDRIGPEPPRPLLAFARQTAAAGMARRGESADGGVVGAPMADGAVVLARLRPFTTEETTLLTIAARDLALAVENEELRESRRRDTIGIVATLIEAIEAKDRFNRGHSRRVADLARRFAHHVGLPRRERELIEVAAQLHDIGKIGVPEEILNKPGRLDDEEFDIIKSHPVIGEQILRPLDFLSETRPIVRHHHERWDGRGYPDGLRGSAIPHEAAMLSIVDAYDAMTSNRPYREGMPHGRALQILRDGAGTQWNPDLVREFESL